MGNSHKENWSKQIVFFLALLAQVMCQDVWSETNNSSSNSARQKKVCKSIKKSIDFKIFRASFLN